MSCQKLQDKISKLYAQQTLNFSEGFSVVWFDLNPIQSLKRNVLWYYISRNISVNKVWDINYLSALIAWIWLQKDKWISFRSNNFSGSSLHYFFEAVKLVWFQEEVRISFRSSDLWPDWVKEFSDVLKQTWLKKWMTLDLIWCLSSENIHYLTGAIESVWFEEWLQLYLSRSQFPDVSDDSYGDICLSNLASIIKHRWLKKWMRFGLENSRVSDVWLWYLIGAIESVWFEENLYLGFTVNDISDIWALALLELIKSKWVKKHLEISLSSNRISLGVEQKLRDEIARQWRIWWHEARISF